MKTRIIFSAAALLLTFTWISCSDGSLFPGSVAFPTIPKFLVAVDNKGAGTNVNVFPIEARFTPGASTKRLARQLRLPPR
jgi:hypothetical protein